MGDILRRPPRVFVVSLGDYAALSSDPPSEFGAWLRMHYRLISTIAGMHVLMWRGDLDNVSAAG